MTHVRIVESPFQTMSKPPRPVDLAGGPAGEHRQSPVLEHQGRMEADITRSTYRKARATFEMRDNGIMQIHRREGEMRDQGNQDMQVVEIQDDGLGEIREGTMVQVPPPMPVEELEDGFVIICHFHEN